MWKRYVFGLSVFALFVFAIMGCQMTPGEKFPVKVRGVVANPDNTCYLDFVANPDITEGLPLPNADLTIVGDQGSRLTARTDAQGVFEFWGKAGEAYVVYAQKGNIRVKKGITTLVSSSDTGEANYFTTAQVIIWEVAEELYPGALPMKDIHLIQPTDALVQAARVLISSMSCLTSLVSHFSGAKERPSAFLRSSSTATPSLRKKTAFSLSPFSRKYFPA
jgi:hypothetical protein